MPDLLTKREVCELLALGGVGRREADALGRDGEPREVLAEEKRPAVVDACRLEDGAAAQQRLVVGGEHRLARIEEAPTCDRDCAHVHHASASNGRAGQGSARETISSARRRAVSVTAI